jgi:hypothetical protein
MRGRCMAIRSKSYPTCAWWGLRELRTFPRPFDRSQDRDLVCREELAHYARVNLGRWD